MGLVLRSTTRVLWGSDTSVKKPSLSTQWLHHPLVCDKTLAQDSQEMFGADVRKNSHLITQTTSSFATKQPSWSTRCLWCHAGRSSQMTPSVAGGTKETPPAHSVSTTSKKGPSSWLNPKSSEILPSCLLIFPWNKCIPALLSHTPRLPQPIRTHQRVSGSFKLSPQNASCCADTVGGHCLQSSSMGLGNTARLRFFPPGSSYPQI